MLKPAPRPCESCPYRRDAPAGLWTADEYEKLPDYDKEPMWEQPAAAFYCHQQDGRLCAGWVACHSAQHHGHVLALRMMPGGREIAEYTTDVPVFASGTEAALHGMSGVERPDEKARKMISKLERRRVA